MKLEDLKLANKVRGIILGEPVTIINAHWIGSNAVELTFKRQNGAEVRTARELMPSNISSRGTVKHPVEVNT